MIYNYFWFFILTVFCFHSFAFSADEKSNHQPESSTLYVAESVYGSYDHRNDLVPMHFRLKEYVFKQSVTSCVIPGDQFYIVNEHKEFLPNNSYRIHLDVISVLDNISDTFVSEIITQETYHKIVDIEIIVVPSSVSERYYKSRHWILTLEDGTILQFCEKSPDPYFQTRLCPNIIVGDYISLSNFCYAAEQWDRNYEPWIWYRKSSFRTEGVYSDLYEVRGIYNSIQFYCKYNENMHCYFDLPAKGGSDFFILSSGPRSKEEHQITSKGLNPTLPATVILDGKPE